MSFIIYIGFCKVFIDNLKERVGFDVYLFLVIRIRDSLFIFYVIFFCKIFVLWIMLRYVYDGFLEICCCCDNYVSIKVL